LIPGRGDIFLFATTQQVPQELFPMSVKWLGNENDHSYLSNVEVTKALPGISRVGCLIKQMNNFKVAVAQSICIWGGGGGKGVE